MSRIVRLLQLFMHRRQWWWGLLGCVLAACRPEPRRPESLPADSIPSAAAPAAPVLSGPTSSPAAPESTSIQLTDRTAQSGITFRYQNGREAGLLSILEAEGGGVALFDFDNDRWLDLYLPGGGSFLPEEKQVLGRPGALYRRRDDWSYSLVTPQAHAAGDRFYSHAAVANDYDNDGFTDLLLTGYGGLQLLRNAGDGTFVDCTADCGLLDTAWSLGAAWGDFNNDAQLDLYVSRYGFWDFDHQPRCTNRESDLPELCGPLHHEPLPDGLYLSLGDGRFQDRSEQLAATTEGPGMGVVTLDVNQDGWQDIYVCNDEVSNYLWINQGDAYFRNEGHRRGVADDDQAHPNGSMGVAIADVNRDGWAELAVSNFETERFGFYRNAGQGIFQYATERFGLGVMGGRFVSWGVAFSDLDLDGGEDLLIANGHALYGGQTQPFLQKQLVFQFDFARQYFRQQMLADPYWQRAHSGRGLAVGDLDGDGRQDVVISHLEEPVAVFRNETVATGTGLTIELHGRTGNRDAIGARLALTTQKTRQFRFVVGGGSYCSRSDQRVHWGVAADDQPVSVEVVWPGGSAQVVDWPPEARELILVEGSPAAVVRTAPSQ